MAKIATCPQCARQLGLPASIGLTDRVECPECHADFLLSETVQISLPVVRVCDRTEDRSAAGNARAGDAPTAVVPTPDVDNPEDDQAKSPRDDPPPRRNWEERLKKALARDSPQESPQERIPKKPEQTANETSQGAATSSRETAGTGLPGLQPAPGPVPEVGATTKDDSQRPSPLDGGAANVAAPTPQLAPSDWNQSEDAASEPVPGVVERGPRRQLAGARFPFIAAWVVGPVVGGLLGLYGLLWLQGTKADVVGLTRVLPASLLPAQSPTGWNDSQTDAGVTTLPPPEERGTETAKPLLAAARQAKPPSQRPSAAMQRDEAVRPAYAAQPANRVAPAVRTTAVEFLTLVDAAATALPDFTASDLTSEDSIKRKGQAYMALCRLAEHFVFAQQPGLAPQVRAKVVEAAEIFRQATRQSNTRQDLAHIAARWWEYEQRPHAGIFLTGQVRQTQSVGDATVCWVQLGKPANGPTIPVWFAQPDYDEGDQIGVVGRISATSPASAATSIGPARVQADYSFRLTTAPD